LAMSDSPFATRPCYTEFLQSAIPGLRKSVKNLEDSDQQEKSRVDRWQPP